MSNQYDDLLNKVTTISDENKAILIENEQLKNENIAINNELDAIKLFINNTKQEQLNNNAILFGLPNMHNVAEIKNNFEKIIQKLEIATDIDELGVADVFQKRPSEGSLSAPVILKFKNQEKKNKLVQLFKTTKITTGDIGLSNNKTIRISEQLTPHNQQLLNAAKQLRSYGFKFIWYNHGKVMVRKNEGSRIMVILSTKQIDDITSQIHEPQ